MGSALILGGGDYNRSLLFLKKFGFSDIIGDELEESSLSLNPQP